MARTGANWRELAQHFAASRVAFGARHMAPSLFHLATHAEWTLIRRHSEPLRATHIIFGANWHQLAPAQWTPSITAPNLNVAATSRHLHRAISAKCPPSGTKWRKQSAYWNLLECNGARQVAPMRFRATWRQGAPCLRHYASQTAPDW